MDIVAKANIRYTKIAIMQKPRSAEISIYGLVIPLLNTKITHIRAATVKIAQPRSSIKVENLFFSLFSPAVTPTKQKRLTPPSAKQKAQSSSWAII